MKKTTVCGDEWPVNVEITDPDPIMRMRPSKSHALKFETSPGAWSVILLSDRELVDLGRLIHNRWEDKVFYGD